MVRGCGVSKGCLPSYVCTPSSDSGFTSEADTGGLPSWKDEWLCRPWCHSWAKMTPPLACTASVTSYQQQRHKRKHGMIEQRVADRQNDSKGKGKGKGEKITGAR